MYYKIKPALKEYLWAGTKLKTKYNKETDLNKVSESWEFSINDSGESYLLIDDKEVLIKDYIKDNFIGDNFKNRDCELLVKLIDAEDDLSIQVHPSDDYAKEHYNKLGKTEMWYILDNKPGSFIYLGFNDNYSKEVVEEALNNGTITSLLNKVEVKRGDFYKIPSGTIHAIGKGITLYEIQENSDLTFRLYDYDRVDKDGNKRQLHINESLDVLNYNKYEVPAFEKERRNPYCSNEYFELRRFRFREETTYRNNQNSFAIMTILYGDVNINGVKYNVGDSIYIEPNTSFKVNGDGDSLIARVPDLALGLDVGGTSIKGMIINDLGDVIEQTKVPTESNLGYEKVLSNMALSIESLIDKSSINTKYFSKVGIGFPGNCDSKKGVVLLSNNLGFRNAYIKKDLESIINKEVIIDNDANCAALGEYYYTSRRRYHDIALLTLGTGVGSGFIIDSKLFKGGLGSCTEFGHIKVKSDNYQCTCGQYGCLEALLSLARLRHDVDSLRADPETGLSDLISDEDSPLKIFDFDKTNEAAKKYAQKWQNNLLLGLINVANVFQPQIILIGGGVSYHVAKYFKSLEFRMNKNKFGGLDAPKIHLEQAELGNEAGGYGACALTKVE